MYASRYDEFINSRIVTPSEYKDVCNDLNQNPSMKIVEDIEKYERQELMINDDM